MDKRDDKEYEVAIIVSVKETPDDWIILDEDGFLFNLSKKYGIQPKAGQVAVFYGEGAKHRINIRGLDLGGGEVFYI